MNEITIHLKRRNVNAGFNDLEILGQNRPLEFYSADFEPSFQLEKTMNHFVKQRGDRNVIEKLSLAFKSAYSAVKLPSKSLSAKQSIG